MNKLSTSTTLRRKASKQVPSRPGLLRRVLAAFGVHAPVPSQQTLPVVAKRCSIRKLYQRSELCFLKDAGRKYVWSAQIADAEFRLLIPKWRVPELKPERIIVYITDDRAKWKGYKRVTPAAAARDPRLLKRPKTFT